MVQTNNLRPRFCGDCGHPLQVNNRALGYDVYTGEPRNEESLFCPKTETVRQGFQIKEVSADHPTYNKAADSDHWELSA